MKINELRKYLNMNQREFSDYIGVPLGTLRNWEQEIRKPPEYVFTMIERILRRDTMINLETIKFINMLNDLAELTRFGYKKWSEIPELDWDDINAEKFEGIIFDDSNENKVVLNYLNYGHHDIIAYYDDCCNTSDFSVNVVDRSTYDETVDKNSEKKFYVKISFYHSEDEVCIENGAWYFI